jgi:hypothetical protein
MSLDAMSNDLLAMHTRRRVLQTSALGFGSLALRGLLGQGLLGNPMAMGQERGLDLGGMDAKRPHFTPRAKRIVFLFMKGGPSHIDTFDPKAQLSRDDGKPPPFELPRVVFAQQGNLLKSPWKFSQ